jgi:hypothetical protein
VYPARQPNSRSRPILLASGVFALLALSACRGQDCTTIGSPSTVTVDTSGVVAGQKGLLSVHFCVNTECRNYHREADRLEVLGLSDPSADDEGPVAITLQIVSENGTGEIVFAGGARVPLTMSQPNGPDCEPTAYSTSLVAHEDWTLTQA